MLKMQYLGKFIWRYTIYYKKKRNIKNIENGLVGAVSHIYISNLGYAISSGWRSVWYTIKISLRSMLFIYKSIQKTQKVFFIVIAPGYIKYVQCGTFELFFIVLKTNWPLIFFILKNNNDTLQNVFVRRALQDMKIKKLESQEK